MFTPDEYYNIVEFTGAGTRRDEVVEEIQQQQKSPMTIPFDVVNESRSLFQSTEAFKFRLKNR